MANALNHESAENRERLGSFTGKERDSESGGRGQTPRIPVFLDELHAGLLLGNAADFCPGSGVPILADYHL
jgi:hypothetical protein